MQASLPVPGPATALNLQGMATTPSCSPDLTPTAVTENPTPSFPSTAPSTFNIRNASLTPRLASLLPAIRPYSGRSTSTLPVVPPLLSHIQRRVSRSSDGTGRATALLISPPQTPLTDAARSPQLPGNPDRSNSPALSSKSAQEQGSLPSILPSQPPARGTSSSLLLSRLDSASPRPPQSPPVPRGNVAEARTRAVAGDLPPRTMPMVGDLPAKVLSQPLSSTTQRLRIVGLPPVALSPRMLSEAAASQAPQGLRSKSPVPPLTAAAPAMAAAKVAAAVRPAAVAAEATPAAIAAGSLNKFPVGVSLLGMPGQGLSSAFPVLVSSIAAAAGAARIPAATSVSAAAGTPAPLDQAQPQLGIMRSLVASEPGAQISREGRPLDPSTTATSATATNVTSNPGVSRVSKADSKNSTLEFDDSPQPPQASSSNITPAATAAALACGEWHLLIHVATFNMNSTTPDELPDALFGTWEKGADLYMFGSQESGSLPDWEKLLAARLGHSYQRMGGETLRNIHLVVFARAEVVPYIGNLHQASVPCGIGNVVGNKGGVAISMEIAGVKVLLVNCHLAAHDKFTEQRNADYHRICSGLFSTQSSIPPAINPRITRTHSSASSPNLASLILSGSPPRSFLVPHPPRTAPSSILSGTLRHAHSSQYRPPESPTTSSLPTSFASTLSSYAQVASSETTQVSLAGPPAAQYPTAAPTLDKKLPILDPSVAQPVAGQLSNKTFNKSITPLLAGSDCSSKTTPRALPVDMTTKPKANDPASAQDLSETTITSPFSAQSAQQGVNFDTSPFPASLPPRQTQPSLLSLQINSTSVNTAPIDNNSTVATSAATPALPLGLQMVRGFVPTPPLVNRAAVSGPPSPARVSTLRHASTSQPDLSKQGNMGSLQVQHGLASGSYDNNSGLLRAATFAAAAASAAAAAAQQPQLTKQAAANLAKGCVLLEAHDVVLWAGDLNYRIQGNAGAVMKAIEKNLVEVLHVNDQLYLQRKQGKVFQGFSEQEIQFPPTFKFKLGTEEYNASRIPSWTDRILFRCNADAEMCHLLPLYYNSVVASCLGSSDHKPVVAGFELRVRQGGPCVAEAEQKSGCSIS